MAFPHGVEPSPGPHLSPSSSQADSHLNVPSNSVGREECPGSTPSCPMLAFHCCDKMREKNSLQEKRFNWLSLHSLGPWSVGPIHHCGLVLRQNVVTHSVCGRAKLLNSQHPGGRESGKLGPSHALSRVCAQVPTHFQLSPAIQVPFTSQQSTSQ